jgi:hypothetical protein
LKGKELKCKRKNGISLIALIITIIILLILAGISVTAVLGDNGIFKMSKKASDKTKDSSIVEELELAWTARLSEYFEKYSKDETLVKSDFFSLDNLNNELTSGIISNYKYKENGETSFTYTDTSTGDRYGILVSNKGKVTIISRNEKTIEDSYLVDVVQIGDYVDIGINYENAMNFYGEYTVGGEELYGEKGPTGWRVLSKSGSGKNGYVTLVSAGTPLNFEWVDGDDSFVYNDGYFKAEDVRNSKICLWILNNLYPDLLNVSDGSGFFKNSGFEIITTDLTQIFGTNKYVDTSKGIHTLMAGTDIFGRTSKDAIPEVEKLYKYITDEKNIRTMGEFNYGFADNFGYQKYIFKSSELGLTLEDKTVDLLGNGLGNWLGGCSAVVDGDNEYSIFVVLENGLVKFATGGFAGVRPVVTLKTGIQVSDNNTGNGYYGSPYTLKYND